MDNSRIAKNSLYLFFRMFLSMGVSLYTSRVILEALGVENYGIFNVVGGIVAFVSYINWGMSSSSQRFITFSIGKGDVKETRDTFSNSWGIHLVISIAIILLAETFGKWFFFDQLNIPEYSRSAAMIVYQVSIANTVIAILCIPFGSLIMAHERMSVYAYLSIIDVLFKLLICYLLTGSDSERLSYYALLLLATTIISSSMYIGYCLIKFPESHLHFKWKKGIMKKMVGFAGWSMVGCTASIAQGQGINLLLNLYGGPLLNAARGLAVQVQGAVNQFVGSFQGAVTPQIIKSYATNELSNMHILICNSAKYSFFLMALVSVPVMCNINEILSLWLVEIPPYTPQFLQIIMINALLGTLSGPLMKSADATGTIKKYHLVVGGSLLLVLPAAYIVLKIGLPVYSVFLVQTMFGCFSLYLRLRIVGKMINMPVSLFTRAVLAPVFKVSLPIAIFCYLMVYICPFDGVLRFLILLVSSFGFTVLTIWNMGMNVEERIKWKRKAKSVISRFLNNKRIRV